MLKRKLFKRFNRFYTRKVVLSPVYDFPTVIKAPAAVIIAFKKSQPNSFEYVEEA